MIQDQIGCDNLGQKYSLAKVLKCALRMRYADTIATFILFLVSILGEHL